jgi:hypothetical protein
MYNLSLSPTGEGYIPPDCSIRQVVSPQGSQTHKLGQTESVTHVVRGENAEAERQWRASPVQRSQSPTWSLT